MMNTRPQSYLERLSTTARFLTTNTADVVNQIKDDSPISTIHLASSNVVVVRSAHVMHDLANCQAMSRGASQNILRAIFGNTLFLLPHGKEHSERKAEFRDGLGKARVNALTPQFAKSASAIIDRVKDKHDTEPDAPVDMNDFVLRYLFKVAGITMTGSDVDLDAYVDRFRANADVVLSGSSSTSSAALLAMCKYLSPFVARPAQLAAREMLDVGAALLRTTNKNHDNTIISGMLKRHNVDPLTINEQTQFSDDLLYDVTMTFAASIFTTSQLILITMDHYYKRPEELQELRRLIAEDFPHGVCDIDSIKNCPTMQKLLPVMLAHSPVSIAGRDVISTHTFEDENGTKYTVNAGDMVIFDLTSIQEPYLDGVQNRLSSTSGPLLDVIDAKNNDVMKAFFDGIFQCPGRYLAMSDSALFLVEALSRLDGHWIDKDKHIEHALVSRLTGSTLMNICPVAQHSTLDLQNLSESARKCPFDLSSETSKRTQNSAATQKRSDISSGITPNFA